MQRRSLRSCCSASPTSRAGRSVCLDHRESTANGLTATTVTASILTAAGRRMMRWRCNISWHVATRPARGAGSRRMAAQWPRRSLQAGGVRRDCACGHAQAARRARRPRRRAHGRGPHDVHGHRCAQRCDGRTSSALRHANASAMHRHIGPTIRAHPPHPHALAHGATERARLSRSVR